MHSMTRRNVVLSAAAAGVAFGLDKRVEIISPAAAAEGGGPTQMNPKGLKFHKFKVGDVEITQVLDGAIERDHNAGLVKNASIDETKAALRAAGLPDEKVPNTYTVTFAKIGGHLGGELQRLLRGDLRGDPNRLHGREFTRTPRRV